MLQLGPVGLFPRNQGDATPYIITTSNPPPYLSFLLFLPFVGKNLGNAYSFLRRNHTSSLPDKNPSHNLDEINGVINEFPERVVSGFEHLFRRFQNRISQWFYAVILYPRAVYALILKKSECPADCIAVYNHLLWTARIQKTNRPYALNTYISKGLKISMKRVKKAKGELKRLGILGDDVIARNPDTDQVVAKYVILKIMSSLKTLEKYISDIDVDLINDDKNDNTPWGSVTTPTDIHPHGNGQQILKGFKEML